MQPNQSLFVALFVLAFVAACAIHARRYYARLRTLYREFDEARRRAERIRARAYIFEACIADAALAFQRAERALEEFALAAQSFGDLRAEIDEDMWNRIMEETNNE
jgi:hypothetical protein